MSEAGPQRTRFPLFGCGVAVLILVLMRTVRWGIETVRVVRPPDKPVLYDGLWNAPLSNVVPLQWTYWPFVLFAVTAAVVVTLLARGMHRRLSAVAVVTLIVGLALALKPEQLVPLTWLALATLTLVPQANGRCVIGWGVAIVVGAIATTIDFALPLVVVGYFLLLWARGRHHGFVWRTFIGLSVGAVAALVFMPGFRLAAARPILWAWRLDFLDLMPSLTPPLAGPHPLIGHLCLLFAIGMIVAEQLITKRRSAMVWGFPILLFAAIGLFCGDFTVLAAVAVALIATRSTEEVAHHNSRSLIGRHWTVVLWFAAFAQTTSSYVTHGSELFVGGFTDGLVDVRDWGARGNTCLLNLDHSEHWSKPHIAERYQLLLTDRFDVPRPVLDRYSLLCQDLRYWKRELYLRVDGSPGGFSPSLNAAAVELIVFDSCDWLTIRRMSVDPKWRLLSLDGTRTIFGRTDRRSTGPQAIKAADLLFHLEWPGRRFENKTEGTIALGTERENVRIATVLSAMRLPYAGLKILAHVTSAEAAEARCWCYAELAHRAVRQTGQPSLLDHPRAVRMCNRLITAGSLDADQKLAARNSVDSLTDDGLQTMMLAMPKVEREIRAAVRSGQLDAATAIAGSQLEDATTAKFYRALIGPKQSSDLNLNILRGVVAGNLRDDLRAEALFYLGCLSLEIGDAEQARRDFAVSQQVGVGFALSPLRDLYLQQMSR